MKEAPSKKEIGQRISDLRKRKGLSQAELSKLVDIPRTSLVQIESGNRSVNIQELKLLSTTLGFSMDEIMSADFSIELHVDDFNLAEAKPLAERISVPHLQVKKFSNVLLYILERCAGKPNVGETVLNKLLYFADFNYYELYEEHLTGAKYRKLDFGPVPQKMDAILNQMMEDGKIERLKTTYYDKLQTRYIPLVKADLTIIKASEKKVIDNVLDQMSDWSASKISNYSHKDMPWLASRDGEEINYELAFYREIPFSVRNYYDEAEEQ